MIILPASYLEIDAFWIEDNIIEIVFIEEPEPGRRYCISLDGSVKTSKGIEHSVNFSQSFFYVNKDTPMLLTNFTPKNAQIIGTLNPLVLSFSLPPVQNEFPEEFSISPSKELSCEWTDDGKEVSISAEDGWTNYTSYTWSYKNYTGVFLVQKDTSPPELLRIEVGNYDKEDASFTLSSTDLELVEYLSSLRFVFSEELSKSTLETALSIEPEQEGRLWQESIDTWLYLPSTGWDQETQYTIEISTDLSDVAGNPLEEKYNSSFKPAILPIEVGSITVVSTSGGSVNIDNLNSNIPVEISVDEPDSSCNINISLSSGEYQNFEERKRFVNSIVLEGYLPPVISPGLINYQWASNNSITLNYSDFIRSLANSPWSRQTYKFTIPATNKGINDAGSYVQEEVSIVFSIAP